MNTIKVLFICSGNKKQGISPIVTNQGMSLQNSGIEVDYFPIKGKGITGYLKHYLSLRKKIKTGNYTVLHAHYSFCGMFASLSSPFNKKVIVSLMGSFYKGTLKYYLIHFFARFFWKAVIVKSEKMFNQINIKRAMVIPNGISTGAYANLPDRNSVRSELLFSKERKYIIFVSDPTRPEKNYDLCKKAVELLNDDKVVLLSVYNKTPEVVIKHLIAADVLMLTSFSEGSPNVIKEAMAAGCPIVTTNVGDVVYIIGNTSGCFVINSFNEQEATDCLKKALDFNNRTNGLQRILEIGLDAMSINAKIIQLYLN